MSCKQNPNCILCLNQVLASWLILLFIIFAANIQANKHRPAVKKNYKAVAGFRRQLQSVMNPIAQTTPAASAVLLSAFLHEATCFKARSLWLFECIGNTSKAARSVSKTVCGEKLRTSKCFSGSINRKWCVMHYGFFVVEICGIMSVIPTTAGWLTLSKHI